MKPLLGILLICALAGISMAQNVTADVRASASPQTAGSLVGQTAGPMASAAAAKHAETPTCGCEGEPQPEILAIVNGVKITAAEVDDAIKVPLKEIYRQVLEARRLELDLQINSRLLEAEAKRRGKTSSQLLQQEVVSRVDKPGQSDAKAYYEQNKDKMDSALDDAIPYIIDFLNNRRQADAAKAFADRLRAAASVKLLVAEATPPKSPADRERVFATINGEAITSASIEDSLRPLLMQAEKQIYNLRKMHLDLRINDTLLAQEAQKRKMTPRTVIEAEVLPMVKKITEEDARKFYEGNKARLPGEFDELRGQIIQYLSEREQEKAQVAFAGQMRAAAAVQVFLNPPETH